MWILVFVPLVFVSMISIAICVWAVRHDRSFELELFCAVNILQFVFLALKLDGIIPWSWEITFIPLWIVLCISLVGVLYTIIFAGILLRMPDVNADQRRSSTNSALGYSFLVVPLLVFLVLLTNKLDETVPFFLLLLNLSLISFPGEHILLCGHLSTFAHILHTRHHLLWHQRRFCFVSQNRRKA